MTGPTPYDEYSGSGIEWVGPIPAGWKTCPLFAVVRENTASNKAGTESNLLSLSYGRIVRKDIAGNYGLLPASFDTYQVIGPDDIVLRLTDLQNDKRSLRSAISPERGIITSAYLAVTPTAIRPKFLSYLLRAYDLQKVFYSMGGGLRQSMKYSDMKWLPVVLPPESTQQAITEYLDRETAQIDELIGKQERLIGLLAEKRQALITHAVTKGLDPSAPTKPSGVPCQGPVPEHWTVQPLKNLIRMQTGVTLGKDFSGVETETYPYLRVANVQIGYVDLNEVKEINLPKEVAATSILRAGDVLMTEGGDRDKLARGCIWEAPIAPCVHQNHIFAVRTGNQLLNEFLVLALDADPARSYFYLTGKQSTNLASTNSTTVKNYRFGVPPMDEQHRIVDHLGRKTRHIDDLVDKANAVIFKLKERRSALIAAAVTGKIDVREGVA
ncbi:restriction endonuclease subunit S [Pseudarthrobacter phenanthrenivorans]|uniref:restriction endonuclease subunit S n=1 Tax=Pseudarthrobacter phenanthrenivorans TaxID=361575 RepID=UPI002F35153F